MPKVKTHSGCKKRFGITGTGSIKRKHSFKRHNLSKRTTKQKRALTKIGLVHDADMCRIKNMLKI